MTFNLAIVDEYVLRITGIPSEEEKEFYENSYTVNVVKYKRTTQEDPEIVEVLFTSHKDSIDESFHNLTKDGHYIIDHIVLYDLDYMIHNSKTGYCTEGSSFYKCINGQPQTDENGNLIEYPLEIIMQVNDFSIYKISQETFSISYLHKYYLDLCKQNLRCLMKNRCSKDTNDFNIDLIWLSINAIRFNLEFGFLTNAQSIIEDLMRCTNACYNQSIKTNERKCCY